MKTKIFLALLLMPSITFGIDRIVSVSQQQVTIAIHGLRDTVDVMHITDSHITVPNQEDEAYMVYAQRMANAYRNTRHFQTGQPSLATDIIAEQLQMAAREKVSFIALTGDIFNYPSAVAVDFVKQRVDSTGIPYLYVAGNHDWHMEGMEGSLDQLRKEWSTKVLAPMLKGGNYLCQSIIVKGVNFVAIDNSTYQVNQEQLDFFKKQLEVGLPIVLLMHIPIYTPSSQGMVMGNPQWGEATDDGYQLERRERWPKEGNSKSTVDFVEMVINTPNITVLCGHTHIEHLNVWKDMVQIADGISRNGLARIIHLVPAE